MKNYFFLLIVFAFFSSTYAQGPVDGFFSPKNELSLTASYTSSNYDEFYVGEEKMSPVPAHNEVKQNIYSLYGKYGLTNDLTLIMNLPYVSAQGEGQPDPFNNTTEQKDFQDLGLFAKYRPASFDLENSNLDIVTALGFNFPLGYEPNGILSIGSGAFSTDLHAGLHYQHSTGFFTSAISGYSFRGEADDNLDINNGNNFDVPNAFLLLGKIGYASSKFYIEGWADYQSSVDGISINDPNFAGQFPETEVDFTRLGLTAYVPFGEAFGASAGFSTVVDGKNIAISNNFNLGLTYNVNL
ncbi:transporter [Salegentibacter sp. JZCK2]|uniref:transporter n=1 Tax=Salegentibacter tibetensis TaxID=2873600 RepID=UPI001CCC0446|nr:transporter [Salegentibacter tibetensis]MBZ9730874.1 transporter [Salegentibacter tibetensis]